MKRPLKRGDDSFSADVFGFAKGSFTIKFRSSHSSDLLGDIPAFSAALEQLNMFLSLASDHEKAIAYLQSVKGHTASSLIKMLSFLSEHASPITVEWATPSMTSARRAAVSLHTIQSLMEVCRQRSDLAIEEVVIVGHVPMADTGAATWKIVSEVDQETYHGEIPEDSNLTLSGMIIADARYEFTCEEILEIVTATGQEKRKLLLRAIKKL